MFTVSSEDNFIVIIPIIITISAQIWNIISLFGLDDWWLILLNNRHHDLGNMRWYPIVFLGSGLDRGSAIIVREGVKRTKHRIRLLKGCGGMAQCLRTRGGEHNFVFDHYPYLSVQLG